MATLTNAQLQFYSSQHITNRLWVEGDSYAQVTGGAGLSLSLRNLGYVVIVTAVGGSSMAGIRDRILADASLIRQCTLVVWDGSADGYTTLAEYVDALEAGLDAIGSDFILVPAGVPYGMTDTVQSAIRDEFEARWPGKVHDWRGSIANTGGVINQDRMLNYPTDAYHLNTTAHDEEAMGVEVMIS